MFDMVGIVGWGAYIPRYRIKTGEIARVWGKDPETITKGLGIIEKSVPALDEDTVTISVEAARNALARAGIDPKDIGSVYVGSESHPYAVKPSGTIVAEALGCGPELTTADLEFACKAGTAGMQIILAQVKAGMVKYGLAIGADTSQGRPGDALEYSAAAGGAAFIIGSNPAVVMEETYSYTTDTPDFWRREGQDYPKHGARFTGTPAYFKHVINATHGLLEKVGRSMEEYDYVVFHMPNAKFPIKVMKHFKIPKEKYLPGLVVTRVGNCYSGSSPLGLSAVLDIVKPGQKILMTSFGSGAGSDSFSFLVKESILEKQDRAPKTEEYIEKNKQYIDYGTYVKMRKKLKI